VFFPLSFLGGERGEVSGKKCFAMQGGKGVEDHTMQSLSGLLEDQEKGARGLVLNKKRGDSP